MYTPPPRKDDKPPAAEPPVAPTPPPEQPFSPEETGADPVETDPGGTPAFAAGGLGQARVPAAVVAPVDAKPGVGDKKPTSLKSVPMSQGGMTDAGGMSLDFTSKAGPPRMPDETPDDSGMTNVGKVDVPNIFGLLKRNRDEKKKGQAESGGGEQADSVSKDATVKNDEVPGASYGKRKKPDPNAKGKPTTEDEDDGEDNEQAAK